MKAKCPRCKTGCVYCDGGYVEVHFQTRGTAHVRRCDACGKSNGGRLTGPGLPPLDPPDRPRPCVWCGSENTRWDPPPPPPEDPSDGPGSDV